jgi:hypothetical protein
MARFALTAPLLATVRSSIAVGLLSCFLIHDSQGANWPLRVSSSGRYLEDQSGVPFLIVADAGWELTTEIRREDAIAYLDDRAARGFNAIEVRVIGHQFQTNAPNNYYNAAPFTNGPSDWSIRNEAYWSHVDYVVSAARDRGIAILMFPSYLGYLCGSEGWCAQMQSQTNAAMTNYGTWIGTRYRTYGNIIWMRGGDVDASAYSNALARDAAVVAGVRTGFPGALFSLEPNNGQIGGLDSYGTGTDINAVYTHGAPQSMVQRAYQNASRPFMFQEGIYENEHGSSVATQESQALITYLGGGLVGHVFGSCPLWSFGTQTGYCDSGSSPFNGWTNNLASTGSIAAGNIGKLMRSRRWWALVPDYSNTVVTSPKGSEFGYHATAREATGETVMSWSPNTNVVTVDMSTIGGTQAKAWWWSPRDNTSVLIGTFATTGTRSFTPSSAERVLVLDNAAANLPAPGTTGYSADTVPPAPPSGLRGVP